MLAEFLADQGEWEQVAPGVRVCLFSLEKGPFPLPLRLGPLHFEALFCMAGAVTLVRRDGSVLTAGARQVLLLAGLSGLSDARVDAPLEGVLVAVDAHKARDSLKALCALLGNLSLDAGQMRRRTTGRDGCAAEGPTDWSRAAFAGLDRLPRSEWAHWCVWKSVELLYLLSAPEGETPDVPQAPALDWETVRLLAETRRYMEDHLADPLTIPALSRRACLSATAFKEAFRRLYGQPVHTWLRQRRMERAAQLLRGSSLSVLGVAQSVGYGSASQFTAAFRRQYGMSPAKYRKNV